MHFHFALRAAVAALIRLLYVPCVSPGLNALLVVLWHAYSDLHFDLRPTIPSGELDYLNLQLA